MRDEPMYSPDDPTQPIQPPQHPSSPQQGQQGKLVIGSFQNAPQQPHAQRRPYQYPPAAPQQPPRYPQSQQQLRQPVQNNQQAVPPNASSNSRGNVNAPQYPYRQDRSAQQPPTNNGNVTPPARKPRLSRRRGCQLGCLAMLIVLLVLGAFTVYTSQRVLAFGSAISTQSPLSTQTGYMGTSDRVNLLVMGYGGGTHPGANLTDSMVVMSLLPQSSHTTLVSVPRDLWVQVPAGSGNYQKINAVYEVGSNNGANTKAGGDAAAQKVATVTGLDVKYWLTINFTGFRDLINSIGGIDVYVPDSFKANYPKNDDPSIDAGWKVVSFTKGTHHMDGETAIEYARAREAIDNLAEGTDFARSARQQIIIKAVLSKVKQMSTWPSLFNAMAALQKTIYTNLSMADLMQFALKMDLNNAHRVGLSNQNVLADTVVGGQDVLLPINNNWQGIKDYVKQQLYN